MNVKRTLIGSPGSGGFRGGVFTMLGPRIRRRFSLNRSNMALGSLSGSGVGVFSVLVVQIALCEDDAFLLTKLTEPMLQCRENQFSLGLGEVPVVAGMNPVVVFEITHTPAHLVPDRPVGEF